MAMPLAVDGLSIGAFGEVSTTFRVGVWVCILRNGCDIEWLHLLLQKLWASPVAVGDNLLRSKYEKHIPERKKKKSYNSDCVSLTCHSFYSFPYGACVMYFFNALAELQKKKKKKVKYTVGACLCNRNHIPNLNPESLLSIQNHFPIGFLHFLSFGFMEIGHLSPHYCHIRYWDKYGACTWTNA